MKLLNVDNVYFGEHISPVYLARTKSEPTRGSIQNAFWRHRTPSGLKLEGYFHYTTTGGMVRKRLENHQIYITAVFGVVGESVTVSEKQNENLLEKVFVTTLYESYAMDCHDLEEVVSKFLSQVWDNPDFFFGDYVLDPRPYTLKIVVLSDGPLSN